MAVEEIDTVLTVTQIDHIITVSTIERLNTVSTVERILDVVTVSTISRLNTVSTVQRILDLITVSTVETVVSVSTVHTIATVSNILTSSDQPIVIRGDRNRGGPEGGGSQPVGIGGTVRVSAWSAGGQGNSDRTMAIFDGLGRQISVGSPRHFTKTAFNSMTVTAATQVLGAGAPTQFFDIVSVLAINGSTEDIRLQIRRGDETGPVIMAGMLAKLGGGFHYQPGSYPLVAATDNKAIVADLSLAPNSGQVDLTLIAIHTVTEFA